MAVFKNTIAAVVAMAALGSGMVATTTPAAARGWGAPLAAGIIGGLAAGAIIGGAARPAYGYGYGAEYAGGYGAYPPPAYGYDPVPVVSPCYRGQTPVYDAYGNYIGSRVIRVCN